MAAITTLRNPLNNAEILVYYYTKYLQLALAQANDKNQREVLAPDILNDLESVDPPGKQEDPFQCFRRSQLAIIQYKNLIRVFGVKRNFMVCLVSPVHTFSISGVRHMASSGSIAATSDGAKAGWLYYFKAGTQKLTEFELELGTELAPSSQPIRDSSLAAFYDIQSQRRSVIYQASGGIRVIDVQVDNDVPIQATANARPNTPFAASTVQRDRTLVYLYYTDANNTLWRVIRDGSGQWGNPTAPVNAPKVNPTSQLTAALSEDKRTNSVVYTQQHGSQSFVVFPDPL